MPGTKAGGKKTAATNLAKDPDFYRKIGAKGGKNSNTGGFASDVVGADGLTGRERARIVGAKGGMKSSASIKATNYEPVRDVSFLAKMRRTLHV